MAKYPNPMLVKASRSYDVIEAARVLGRTPSTIRHWIKDGLEVLAARKPYLILGQAIRDYIRAKSASRKTPLAQDELYCFSCKVARRPRKQAVTVIAQNDKTLRLSGACTSCGCTCSRIISASKVHGFSEVFAFEGNAPSKA